MPLWNGSHKSELIIQTEVLLSGCDSYMVDIRELLCGKHCWALTEGSYRME